jgi:drug/metabolite transporter (DMT)-like permease
VAASSTSAVVVAVVLIAALTHASWNAIAHAITDRLAGITLIALAGAGCGLVALPFVGPAPRVCWPFLLGSATVHVAYNLLLVASYRLGDFGHVYPLARGTSPWVVAIIATLGLGEALPAWHLIGVLLISAGLVSLVFAAGVPWRSGRRGALGASFATGLAIAGYTVLDGIGVRRAHGSWSYTASLFLLEGAATCVATAAIRRRSLWSALRPHWRAGTCGGLLSVLAYGLVLWAQTRDALASVAALRETSVVFGAIIGSLLFHERFGRTRTFAAVLVCCGVLLISL